MAPHELPRASEKSVFFFLFLFLTSVRTTCRFAHYCDTPLLAKWLVVWVTSFTRLHAKQLVVWVTSFTRLPATTRFSSNGSIHRNLTIPATKTGDLRGVFILSQFPGDLWPQNDLKVPKTDLKIAFTFGKKLCKKPSVFAIFDIKNAQKIHIRFVQSMYKECI